GRNQQTQAVALAAGQAFKGERGRVGNWRSGHAGEATGGRDTKERTGCPRLRTRGPQPGRGVRVSAQGLMPSRPVGAYPGRTQRSSERGTVGPTTIGGRVRQLRRGRKPRLTQRELAERAGVSVDLISKLEQGIKQTTLLGTLHKIAAALDVDVSMLLSRPTRIDVAADDQQPAGVLAIRRAITAVREDHEAASLEELGRSTGYAWSAYWTNRFDLLGGLLPELIPTARATARQTESAGAFALLSEVYGVTASTLVHLGRLDLAHLVMERAVAAAD